MSERQFLPLGEISERPIAKDRVADDARRSRHHERPAKQARQGSAAQRERLTSEKHLSFTGVMAFAIT
ncbi:MAG TPA: hypothetical protein EYN93_11870 [Planctomycetaceae bacterium]|nr:hypothetical protein [Planctomycetaceae bacterium]